MKPTQACRPENLHYLKMLARQYPTVQAASTEIINLQAILNLPKGTEHFISDVHGEYEAFLHILNSASGVVREKLDDLFAATVSKAERDQLATLIYYPKEKLEEIQRETPDMREWYRITFHRLIEICRWVSSNTPAPRCARPCPRTTPISSMNCSTLTTRTTISVTTTRTSSPPSSTLAGPPTSWCSSASSSSAWRWTTSTWWGHLRPGPPGGHHSGLPAGLPQRGHTVGQPRRAVDGGGLRLPHPGGHGAGQLPALQQPGGHRDGLRHLSAPPVCVCQRGVPGLRRDALLRSNSPARRRSGTPKRISCSPPGCIRPSP